MKTVARCPASCGELIQGWINGSEKLISCPINWYSEVMVSQEKPDYSERPYMRLAAEKTLQHFAADPTLSQHLHITYNSTIPVAKGMASSTADIAATIVATACWLQQPISAQELSALCISIEPTDSTLFPQLTLFDHLTGQYQQHLGQAPELDILILEPTRQLKTADYRSQPIKNLLESSPLLNLALDKVIVGCQKQLPEQIAEAATLSAIANQKQLPKAGFNQLLSLVDSSACCGLCVAHSGTVIGLLLTPGYYEQQQLLEKLQRLKITDIYPKQHWCQLISGGIEVAAN